MEDGVVLVDAVWSSGAIACDIRREGGTKFDDTLVLF
jgi:hypothetical protein